MLATILLPLLAAVQPTLRREDPATAARALLHGAPFRAAKAAIRDGYDRTVTEIVRLTEVPAPPFTEQVRGSLYRRMLEDAGLTDVQIDPEGNVLGYRRGTGGGPLIVVAAHLDTVFPAGTIVAVKRNARTLRAPGIGDDSASLAVLLTFARAMDAAAVRTQADIVFVGTVGEEGPGNLRGVRYLLERSPLRDRIAAFIAFEPDRAGVITNGGVGSKRYQVAFSGPGGHSYEDFGLVNPAYALADTVTRISALALPTTPKTTASVGLIAGGTSVNAIPTTAMMAVDIRSEDAAALARADAAVRAIPAQAADRENRARSTRAGRIAYTLKPIGDRPGGRTDESSLIVRLAAAAATAAGLSVSYAASSTDANLAISRGIPALTLGAGFAVAGIHTPEESLTLDPPNDVDGMAVGLATVLLIAGVR